MSITLQHIEIVATLCSLTYIILLINERIACWAFGIVGSALSIYLFIASNLYSEAILYSFYVVMGIWGWVRWSQRSANNANPIISQPLPTHFMYVATAATSGILLGYFFDQTTDAARPYIDALTTTFSFAATYMEVKKVLQTWHYWLVLNAISIWLYQDRNLDIYAGLTVVYTVLSVYGFMQWRKAYIKQSATS